MKYKNEIKKGRFISRPNRFIAEVEIDGVPLSVHVKNTGRCRELLIPGAAVYLEKGREGRKTPYDLIAVEKTCGERVKLINMDSSAPNRVAEEWLAGGLFSKSAKVRSEVSFGNSRFDFFVEDGDRKAYIEVKGVTLENSGSTYFPDAPTSRGVKHLKELVAAKKQGYEAVILFVIQMKGARSFAPNRRTDPEFADALAEAVACGVEIFAYDCDVSVKEIKISERIKEIYI